MKNVFRVFAKTAAAATAAAALTVVMPATAAAQSDPNPGALTVTGGVDFPAVYVFRGIVQESDPGFTMFPYVDLGWNLHTGEGTVKSVGVNVGSWHSLQTGSSGSDGPSDRLHYEEDFYATLALGFGGGYSLGTTYTAYTSPNDMFTTVKEISFKVSKSHWLNPYGVLAFEIGGDNSGQADGGEDLGTYLELGVSPAVPLKGQKFTLAVPVKLGMSLKNYYELNGDDQKFGYFDIGALFTFPLSTSTSPLGAWNVHAGFDTYFFGHFPETVNDNNQIRWVPYVGVGFTY